MIQKSHRRLSRGITLLELLVALTLIAILSALVYPSFGNALSILRLRGAARQLVSACRLAKWEAVSRRQPYRLSVDMERNQLSVADAAMQTVKELDLSPGIHISETQKISGAGRTDVNEFMFFPNGTSEAGSITLRDQGGREVKVLLDFLTGEAKISE